MAATVDYPQRNSSQEQKLVSISIDRQRVFVRIVYHYEQHTSSLSVCLSDLADDAAAPFPPLSRHVWGNVHERL